MTIHVRNWEKFQHRDVMRSGQTPPWIKDYTRQLSDDDYLSLSFHCRGILQGLRLEYARAGRGLPDNTATLSRRLGQRVTRRDLDALNRAGFLEIVPAGSAQNASLEERREEQTVRSNGSVDVAAPVFDPDELEAWDEEQSSTETPPADELAARRDARRGYEHDGKPSTAIGDVLEGLLARAQSP